MGRSKTTARYEITPLMKELMALGKKAKTIGWEVNVDITQDLVTINNYRRYTYIEAKEFLINTIKSGKQSQGSESFPDHEQVAREEKAKAKLNRKHREPGAPPELKTLIRRAKRIYKKCFIKTNNSATASLKSTQYIEKKTQNDNDLNIASSALLNYIAKEKA